MHVRGGVARSLARLRMGKKFRGTAALPPERTVRARQAHDRQEGAGMLFGRPVWMSLAAAALLAACSGETGTLQGTAAESCMQCHNGSLGTDYSGPGIENPHPFVGAENVLCTTCHGGNPHGTDMLTSHVPPPPQVGDRTFQTTDATAYFNKLTLAGMDKFPDYTVNGVTYSSLDYLQFVNPGDLRVTQVGRSCGACHANHAEATAKSLLSTETGIWGGAAFAVGMDNQVPENVGLDHNTASDLAFRAQT